MELERWVSDLAKEMPLRFVRKHVKKILKTYYLAGDITKQEYKGSKRKLKVLIRGL